MAKAAETALAVVAPEALLPAIAAGKATKATVDTLTGDLAVVRVQYPRGTKKNPLPPIEVEYHVNLVGIGIGAFLAALAALVGVIAWEGTIWTPGLKHSELAGRRQASIPRTGLPPVDWLLNLLGL